MKLQEFLAELPELLRSQLPPDLQEFVVLGPRGSLIQFHFGDPHIHYEVWIQRRRQLLEVGLHFEGGQASNLRWLEALSTLWPALIPILGPETELEQWTASWTRVHQHIPLAPLDEDFLLEVSTRMSRLMRALQPLVEEGVEALEQPVTR
ncbi:MAG: hypothetical protein FJ316_10090 [SAR202 cluster bacterium]|nr:hypothetical protein [SAR202 cluster bacterium]